MARFIQDNPMAGVGNAERLALMRAQYDIQKAQKPTAVDRLSQFGQEIINYQADKAKVQVMAQKKQQEMELQQQERDRQIEANMAAKGFRRGKSGEWVRDEKLVPQKTQKPLAPHYGPVYGRGGKYYQSVYQIGPEGKPVPSEMELGGEPMQISAQKQAVLARYADDERADAQDEYDRLKTYAAVQANPYGDNPAKYTAAYNQAMKTGLAKLKKPRIKQAVTELWGSETTPVQGSGGQQTTPSINPMTGKPYGQGY